VKKIIIFHEAVADAARSDYAQEMEAHGVSLVMDLPFMDSMILRVPVALDSSILANDSRVKAVQDDQKMTANGDGGSGDGGSGDGGSGDGGSGDGGSGDGSSGDGGSLSDPPPKNSFIKWTKPLDKDERPWGFLDAFWLPFVSDWLTNWFDGSYLNAFLSDILDHDRSHIRVAVLDSGIDYTHDRIDQYVFGGIDLVHMLHQIPMDDNGHGTHVAGTIAGEALGLAEGVQLYAVKVLDHNAEGEISTLLMGFQCALDNQINVINLSVAYKEDNPAVRLAVQKTHEAGIIMVAAVGNHFNWEDNGAAAILAGAGDGGSGDGGSGDGGSGDGGSGDGGSGDGGSGDGGSGDGGSAILSCDIDPEGTLIDALNFSQTFGGSTYVFESRSEIPGFQGAGYLYNPKGKRSRQPLGASMGKSYRVNFPEPGTYTVWIRGYAENPKSDSIFVGLDGVPVGALRQKLIYGQWAWSKARQRGSNKLVVSEAGEHTIDIWVREAGFALDALFLSSHRRAVANGDSAPLPAATAKILDPAGCGVPGVVQPEPPKVYAVMYPAKYSEVIAVGAHDPQWDPAPFANSGPEMDLTAPGVDIVSLNLGDGNFGICSGTTMAAPHVTGAVALMLTVDDDLSPQRAKDILRRSAHNHTLDVEYALKFANFWRYFSDAQYFDYYFGR
jgi:subtilisin family serine protease